jgi:hypothetical protein
MKKYLSNRYIRIGLVLVGLGWTPLFSIILLTDLGLTSDPNPNPIGPGMLFYLTAWPAIICLVIGIIEVRRRGAVARDFTRPTAGAPRR